MASRESQGLQIALILFIMITVVLAVTTFYFYRQAEGMVAKVASSKKAKETADALVQDQSFWNDYLRHVVGAKTLSEAELSVVLPSVEGDPEMAKIQADFEQDIVTYGDGLPQEKLNYRELPGNLLMQIRKLNVSNTDLTVKSNSLVEQRRIDVEAAQEQTKQANAQAQSFKDELAEARVTFKGEVTRVQQEKEDHFASYRKKEKTLQVALIATGKKVEEGEKAVSNLQGTITQQTKRITELLDEPFETPDGRIAWVNQAAGTVWVNLGLADGLRRQVTFSVYDHEALNVAPGAGRKDDSEQQDSGRKVDERKGKIEITRVLDQHLAEARIVEDFAADPILPGDQIFSPAWKPGRKVRFALVGFMDIDGDRLSDRDLVRNVITMSGGRIDAEVHDDGELEGTLDVNTRYLVRGDQPDGGNAKLLQEYSKLVGTAQTLGIQEITLPMLLELMGYKPEVRTVGLGKRADPLQFKAEPAEGRQRTSTSGETFKPRTPPRRKSAY